MAALRPGRTLLLTQAAGDGATSIDLYFVESCELRLNYRLQVPVGIDPPFSLSVGGTGTAVPEPTTAGLWRAGLLVVAAARRRATNAS